MHATVRYLFFDICTRKYDVIMKNGTAETLGTKLRRLRMAAGMSQEDVAKSVGKSAQMGGKWERDEAVPHIEVRLALANLFGVDPAELGYEVPTEYSPSAPAWYVQSMEQMQAQLNAMHELLKDIRYNQR